MDRRARIAEGTHGFSISVEVNLDGVGNCTVATGLAFLDHMIELLAKHGSFDIVLNCQGDVVVDDHHTVDEVAMALGAAFAEALKCRRTIPINRYGFYILPMDEVLTTVAVDLCGRTSFVFDVEFNREMLGSLSTEMIKEFWGLFMQKLMANCIVKSEYGYNDHHIAEGIFKCLAKALRMAINYKLPKKEN